MLGQSRADLGHDRYPRPALRMEHGKTPSGIGLTTRSPIAMWRTCKSRMANLRFKRNRYTTSSARNTRAISGTSPCSRLPLPRGTSPCTLLLAQCRTLPATRRQSMPHRSAIDWLLDAIVYTYYRNLRIPGPTMPLSLARFLRGSLDQLGNRSQPNNRSHHQYPTA